MDTITNQLRNTPVHALEILPALVAPKDARTRVKAISARSAGGGRRADPDDEGSA